MEALAAASSVFAVVSLAGQLASNVQALIEFWESMKEAPAEVAEIQCQLHVLRALLCSMEFDHQDFDSSGDDIATGCFGICAARILKLEHISTVLDKGLNGNGVQRRWTRLKKALREKKLAAYWSELERAKSTLIMYQGWRNGQTEHRLLSMLMDVSKIDFGARSPLNRNELLLEGRAPMAEPYNMNSRTALRQAQLETNTYEARLSFGIILFKYIKSMIRDKKISQNALRSSRSSQRKTINVTFLPCVPWFKVLQCTLTQSFGSFSTSLQAHQLRPGWSPIFDLAGRGDLRGVRRLFNEGRASPNDVNSDGWTVLHCAAFGHHFKLCKMLIEFGAMTNSVTNRQETPLLVATQKAFLCPTHLDRNVDDSEACLKTLRVLVSLGKNDPMEVDFLGYNSLLKAAGDQSRHSNNCLPWLLVQDEFEINLHYVTPNGHTAAAYIITRNSFSPSLLVPLLKCGVDIDGPCRDVFYYRFPRNSPSAQGPSMIQCAIWTWYNRLLNSHYTHLPWGWDRLKTDPADIPGPQLAIRTLLKQGANLHRQPRSGNYTLDGILHNIIQFDGYARSTEALAFCMRAWFAVLKDLDVNTTEYVQCERKLHTGRSHDLGLGIRMEARFDENTEPHIWAVFQGPEERVRDEFVDNISKCASFKTWEHTYTSPIPPPRPRPMQLLSSKNKVLVFNGDPIGPRVKELTPVVTPRRTIDKMLPSHFIQTSKMLVRHLYLAARNPHEYSFYVFILTSFLGCGYLTRFWVTLSFYLMLKLARDIV